MTDKLIKSIIQLPHTQNDDQRVGHLLANELELKDASVAIIGFPSDDGVARNGGRVGAANAPDTIRHWFYRLTPNAVNPNFAHKIKKTIDLGNLILGKDLAENQQLLGELVADCLSHNVVPIILGGGHETGFGHFLGYARSNRPVNIINWDAHADVRELINSKPHSGSPFRQAILDSSGCCLSYTVVGLQPCSIASAHLDFITAHQGAYHWASQVDEHFIKRVYNDVTESVMTTFCMDVVRQSEAPGVSAPAVNGITAQHFLLAAESAGRCKNVTSFDLVEVNPNFDQDDHTARLAALTIWCFINGLAQR